MPKQNIRPSDYPQAVLQQIAQLARNIVVARKRRGETQAQWARKLGVSQPTMARIERGDPAVSMASYVMCLWLINQAEGLADLVAPLHDHAALEQELARIGSRRAGVPDGRSSVSGKREGALARESVAPPAAAEVALSTRRASSERPMGADVAPPTSKEDALRKAAVGHNAADISSRSAYEEAIRQAGGGAYATAHNSTAAGLAALLGLPRRPSK